MDWNRIFQFENLSTGILCLILYLCVCVLSATSEYRWLDLWEQVCPIRWDGMGWDKYGTWDIGLQESIGFEDA